jgi:hypothetical protein
MNSERGTLNPESRRDDPSSDMTATYIRVIVIEVLIIVALWVLGRTFS